MEAVREFLEISSGSGYGDGSGYGSGSGSGYGDGSGYGSGSGSGDGYGDGSGSGSGYGDGDGSGSGSGYGYGSGYGDGSGIKSFCGKTIYRIDDVPTILTEIRHGFGIGFILNGDLTTTPCFVAKANNLFAHGETIRQAREALSSKLFQGMSVEERVAAFMESHNATDKYSGHDLYEWHHRLTGSCEMGRKSFIRDHGLDIDGEYTVDEFIALTENAYNGAVIRALKEAMFSAREIEKGESNADSILQA